MDYAVKQLNDAKTSGDVQGSVYVEDSKKKYEINPRSILTGFIDGDDKPDAIVSVLVRFKQGAIIDEHLILLQSNGKLNLVRTIEQNMIIVLIAKGIITTEYHTKPRTSPLYNCEKCTEIRDYVFRDNDLIELKQDYQSFLWICLNVQVLDLFIPATISDVSPSKSKMDPAIP